jgi:hypothetical protein
MGGGGWSLRGRGGRESEGGYRRHRAGTSRRARRVTRAREGGCELRATSTIEVDYRRSGMQDIRAEKIDHLVGEEQLFQLTVPATCE